MRKRPRGPRDLMKRPGHVVAGAAGRRRIGGGEAAHVVIVHLGGGIGWEAAPQVAVGVEDPVLLGGYRARGERSGASRGSREALVARAQMTAGTDREGV